MIKKLFQNSVVCVMAGYSLCKMQLHSISPVVFLPRLVWCLEGRLRTAGQHSHGCSLILLLSNTQTMQQQPQDRSPPRDWLQARPNSPGRICSKRAFQAGSSSHTDGSQPPLNKVWVHKLLLSLGYWERHRRERDSSLNFRAVPPV